ncbi:hypothetical protein N3K66_007471 [Trichothecium roseum]|uniref:Uncharacterized protein n=1 Tax=Trichothecium roseum TaxID=47278 RepID=A0ACC0UV65_9HYPO|nr:hypothetical protein N3K66_007471 [Trichothecium roseum]
MAELKIRPDPAYQKLAAMQKTRHKYFRFTPRAARLTFIYVVAIPTFVGYLAYKTEGMIDFRAKRKGDTLFER